MYSFTSSTATLSLEYYPFLGDPDSFAKRRYGLPASKLAGLRKDLVKIGFERVLASLKGSRRELRALGLEEEVLGFAYASALVILSNDRWLLSRFALAEAERAIVFASRESDQNLIALARLIGIKSAGLNEYREPAAIVKNVIVYIPYPFSLSIPDYVKFAKRLLGDDSWRLTNLPVLRGYVHLDRNRFIRLLKEALNIYIEERVKTIGEAIAVEASDSLEEFVQELRKKLSSYRKPLVSRSGKVDVPQGVIVEEAFPPCIRDLVERARKGENLSHHERFAVATFLLNIGAEIDYVVDMFRNMPDFNEKITRYQVEHLAGLRGSGKKYRVYSCEKMRTLGICRADCQDTRSPLTAYYRNLRKLNKELRQKP